MGYDLLQSGTGKPLQFFMVKTSDKTPFTGGSPAVEIRKPGGAFAAPAGAVAEVGHGWYEVAGNAADTGTLGPLLLRATAATADEAQEQFEVVAFNSALAYPDAAHYTNVRGDNLTNLDAAVSSRSTLGGTAQTGDNFARLGAPAGASIAADIAGVSAATVAALAARVLEGTLTWEQAFRIVLAASASNTTGMDTPTGRIKDIGNTKDRVVATLDGAGNRTVTSRDGT